MSKTATEDRISHLSLLTAEETMKILRVGRRTLSNYMTRKRDPIPSKKIGATRRFQLDKVLWWIENQSQ